ncbi:TPA: hypothetical protein ACGX4U_002710 [Enterococcus faecalis]
MARKTAKQIREEEQKALERLKQKAEPSLKEQDKALFENIETIKKKKDAELPEIKAYFEEYAIGKQGSFYLNEPLMKLLRTKVVADEKSIAEVVRYLLIEYYFTEEELRKIYNTIDS